MTRINIVLAALAVLLLTAVPTLAQEEPLPTGSIIGQVANLTPNGETPGELDLMLHAWDKDFNEKLMEHGQNDAAGSFRFEEVTLNPDWLYAVMLTYEEVSYFSEPTSLAEGETALTIDVAVYDKTSQTAAVQVERQHVFFDAAQGGLMVGEVYVLSNLGDRTIAGGDGDDAQISPLQFSLPEEAASVTFEGHDDGRFLRTPDGFVDTAPLRPGEETGQVIVRYVLPYEEGMTYTLAPNWPTNGFSVLVPEEIGITLAGDGLSEEGSRDMGGGRPVTVFSHPGLPAGDSLELTLSGELPAAAGSAPGPSPNTNSPATASAAGDNRLIAGAAILGLVLIGIGLWGCRRSGEEEDEADMPGDDFDDLVLQIAQLDAAYEQGDVGEIYYERQRAALRRQVQTALAQTETA